MRRSGFMLLEVVIALVILIILAAVVTPVMLGAIDAARVENASKTFSAVAAAAQLFDDAIGSNTGPPANRSEYPLNLSQLTTPITTAQSNVCARAYDAGDVSAWNGPYLTQVIGPTGLKTGIGTINDLTVLLTTTTMAFRTPNVTWEDAIALNELVDGDGYTATGSPGGTVRFGAANPDGLVTLDYVIPIQSC